MAIDLEALVNANNSASQASELARRFLTEKGLLHGGIVVPKVEFVDSEQTRHAILISDPDANFATFVISYDPKDTTDQTAQVHPSVLESNVKVFGEDTIENYQKAAIQETLLIIAAVALIENDDVLEQLSTHVINELIRDN